MTAAGPAVDVIFGAGAAGCALAAHLAADPGRQIRLVSRGAPRHDVPASVEVRAADLADPAQAITAARGAAVIYQVLNPPYHRWAAEWPALHQATMAAAEHAGARLVALDNLYAYGPPGSRPFTETDPSRPGTRKGRVRAAMTAELLAAHQAGRLQAVIARASDYYGPHAGEQSNLGDRAIPALLTGKPAQVIGDPDQPHAYTYLPDIAAGLAALARHPAAPGRIWHLPTDPRPLTTRQLIAILHAAAGAPGRPRIRSAPWWALRLAGLASPTLRELPELRPHWTRPYLIDTTRSQELLGLSPTPYEDGLAATAASYPRPAYSASAPVRRRNRKCDRRQDTPSLPS